MTRRFLVAGGGAHLIEAKLRGVQPFVVLPNPSYANVLGAYVRAFPPKPHQLTVVA